MRTFRTRTKLLFLFGAVTLVFLANLLNLFRLNGELGNAFFESTGESKADQLKNSIRYYGSSLKTAVEDFSWWDDMIEYAENPQSDWATENFLTSFKTFHLHGAWLYNSDSNLVFALSANDFPGLVADTALTAAVRQSLRRGAFGHFYAVSNSALIEVRTAPLQPTADIDRTSPARGFLAFADVWDSVRVSELAAELHSVVEIKISSGIAGSSSNLTANSSPGQFTVSIPVLGVDSVCVAEFECTYTSNVYGELLSFDRQLVISIWLLSSCILILLVVTLTKWVSGPLNEIMASLELGDPSKLAGLGRAGSDFQRIAQLVEDFFLQRKNLESQIAIQHETERELRLVQEQLRREMRTTELILQSAGEGICGLDKNGHVTFLNHAASEILGWSSDEVLGRPLHDLAHHTSPQGRPLAREDSFVYSTYKYGQSRRSSSEMCWRKDGSSIPVEIVSAPIMSNDEPIGAVVIFRDLTERKKAEEQLGKLWLAIEQSPTSIVITDINGKIENVNPKFLEVSGYTADEVIGRTPRILRSGVHTKEFYSQLWETLRSGKIWRGEFCNRKKNGGLYWEFCAIAPVRDMLGELTHFIALKEDITERKRSEQLIQEAKNAAVSANRAKSAFLASMSHEIRTPMNSILGYSQLLARDSALSKQSRQYVEIVNRSGEHLLDLINDILEMSKIESGRVTVELNCFSVDRLIDDLDDMFRVRAESKQLLFTVKEAGQMQRGVVSDESKVRQILINLIGNAIKFTPRGGVTLRAELLAASDTTGLLVADVEDTGNGISPEEVPRLFKHFEQTESGRNAQSGTGLGLAISREYARLLGGDISVTSEPGVGSCFHLEIPIGFDTVMRSEIPTVRRKIIGIQAGEVGPRVLVVDDNRQNRGWLLAILTEIGFDTREAVDGREAVDTWLEWRPHLILMDIHMDVMDGVEATKKIRNALGGKDVVIIGISASAFKNDVQIAISAGMDDFASKPLKIEDLFAKIGKHLSVRYVYGDIALGTTEESVSQAAVRLSPENLDDLPADLVRSLREATLNGDTVSLMNVIKSIEQVDWAVADALNALVEQFDYDAILELTNTPMVKK